MRFIATAIQGYVYTSCGANNIYIYIHAGVSIIHMILRCECVCRRICIYKYTHICGCFRTYVPITMWLGPGLGCCRALQPKGPGAPGRPSRWIPGLLSSGQPHALFLNYGACSASNLLARINSRAAASGVRSSNAEGVNPTLRFRRPPTKASCPSSKGRAQRFGRP